MRQSLQFSPEQASVREARDFARESAVSLGASSDAGDTLALVVDELVNNSIEHGAVYRKHAALLSLSVSVEDAEVSVEFIDPDMPPTMVSELARMLGCSPEGLPAAENERGRGLFLISIFLVDIAVGLAAGGGLRLRGRLQQR